MLKVDKLSKNFGSNPAVKDVSFNVGPGEIYALIGPNGSGKTTIVKTVAGLLQPSAGRIVIGGKDAVSEAGPAKQLTGYIPDEPSVWPHLNGEEYLHFVGALYGVAEEERRKKIPQLLSIFNLSGIEQEYFEEYSRGNKQKFTVLAAFLHKPKLLLIDEPIVGLDPVSAETAQEQFVRFSHAGGAVLLVTHTLYVAQQTADRIGVLKNGRLAAEGTFNELKQKAGLGEGADLGEVYKKLAG